MTTHTTHTSHETMLLGEQYAQTLDSRQRLYILTGDLGGGKTTFLQGLARGLGIRESITSPTFVVMKVYTVRRGPFRRFCHLDAYRLQPPIDLTSLGLHEYLNDPQTFICIEWGEKIAALLPQAATIHFTLIDADTREITLPATK